jgi:hypothetical protein
VAGGTVDATHALENDRLTITLANPTVVHANESLSIALEKSPE